MNDRSAVIAKAFSSVLVSLQRHADPTAALLPEPCQQV